MGFCMLQQGLLGLLLTCSSPPLPSASGVAASFCLACATCRTPLTNAVPSSRGTCVAQNSEALEREHLSWEVAPHAAGRSQARCPCYERGITKMRASRVGTATHATRRLLPRRPQQGRCAQKGAAALGCRKAEQRPERKQQGFGIGTACNAHF